MYILTQPQHGIFAMMALHIADEATSDYVDQLAKHEGVTKTEAVKRAVVAALLTFGVNAKADRAAKKPSNPPIDPDLETEARTIALEYARLLARHKGNKAVGTYAWGDFKRDGVVGAITKYVRRGTGGLDFLVKAKRLDLAYEQFAVDPRFEHLFDEETRRLAAETLKRETARIAGG
jgi:Rv0623-like transcription factor